MCVPRYWIFLYKLPIAKYTVRGSDAAVIILHVLTEFFEETGTKILYNQQF